MAQGGATAAPLLAAYKMSHTINDLGQHCYEMTCTHIWQLLNADEAE